jgi:DNA-binding MurR/RpiR family transcriptional regulator
MTDTLAERLDASYEQLTPQEQRAADFMRGHLADLAVYNATEVAQLSGVSKATVSRLYRRLGYEGADALRDHVRALRQAGTPVASDAPHAAFLEHELATLRSALTGLDVAPAADAIAAAERVLVLGFRNSYPMALHLRQQLAQARAGVQLAPQPSQSVGEELPGLTAQDAVVVVAFRRRPAGLEALLAEASATGSTVVLVTDPSGRRLGRHAAHVIECPLDSVSAFDSYAAAASVISLLASTVLARLGRAGAARVAAIDRTYGALGELEGA